MSSGSRPSRAAAAATVAGSATSSGHVSTPVTARSAGAPAGSRQVAMTRQPAAA